MINFQNKLILNSVTFDVKSLPERITKLTEELGELSGAILSSDSNDIFEETIDNIMVILSIYVDLGGSLEELEKACNDAILSAKGHNSYILKSNAIKFLEYATSVGKFAETAQKYSKISTSAYKGTVDKETIIKELKYLTYDCAYFLGSQNSDFETINNIIAKKNSKWFKNAFKGFMFNNNIKEVKPLTSYLEVVELLKEYEHLYEDYNLIYLDTESEAEQFNQAQLLLNKKNYFVINCKNDDLKDVLKSQLINFGYVIIT